MNLVIQMPEAFCREKLERLDYETPFFLISETRICANLRELNDAFPGAAVYYAMKANSEPDVLRTVLNAGAGFEIASAHELAFLKPLHVPSEKIIYSTPVKATAHIKKAFDYGVNRFAFDSLSELEKIAAAAPGARVYARVKVDDVDSFFASSEKFGIENDEILPLFQRAYRLGLRPYGVSFYVGSQARNAAAWGNAIEGLAASMALLKCNGIEIEAIDIGGGFPCAYTQTENNPSLPEVASEVFEKYEKLPYQPKLILEPGRKIVADAAVLVTSVIARIERKGATWLFLDAGVYNALYEALAFQGSTRYRINTMRPSPNSGQALFALAGPTGDGLDVVTREVLLPRDIDVGDKLIFHSVGAYSLTVASRFNGFPKPDVYFC